MLKNKINRQEIQTRFQCSPASATRVLSIYRSYASSNIFFLHEDKMYHATDSFCPQFLTQQLSDVLEDSENIDTSLANLMRPTNQLISNLSKAISNNLIVSLSYSKPKNIAHIFEFSPHSLIKIRDTWYVRGYNKSSEHFEHFKCSLIEASAPFVSEQVTPSDETKQSDVLWHNTKQLKLSPHPLLKSENLAEIGSLMTDKSVVLEVREAILCEFSALYNLDGLQSICTCEKTDDYQLVCEVLS